MSGAKVVKSAVEAEISARSFVATRFPYAIVQVHKVSYRRAEHTWEAQGSYRLPQWIYMKRFLVEIDADDGNIIGFEF